MILMRIIGVLCIVAFVASAAEQDPTPRFPDAARLSKLQAALPEIEKIFEKALRDTAAPSIAYGVVIDGELALVKGLGVADRESRRPVTPDTVFRIASMTKSFTALCILKLRDAGKLSLEDPVAKWIPELRDLRYPTADSVPIRIRDLLTHGGGLPEDNPWGDRQLAVSNETMGRWLKTGLPFSTPPDTAFEYSNYGFAILGRIVASVSGVPYAAYLKQAILDPLGMSSSGMEASQFPSDRLAVGYRRSGEKYVVEPSLADGAFGAMGGLHTSARDLARYVAFMLSAFPPRDGSDSGPVRRASVREMQRGWRPEFLSAGRLTVDAPLRVTHFAYGYGLDVRRECDFGTTVSHGGGLPGFGSFMAWLPEHGVGLFSMTNLTYTSAGRAINDSVQALRSTGALLPRELPPAPSLAAARDAITKWWSKADEQALARAAADNLFLDSTAEDRRTAADKIVSQMGVCRPSGDIRPENWLRGSYYMSCDRGRVRVTFTLAPTMPARIQSLRFESLPLLAEELRRTAERVAASVDPARRADLAEITAPSLDRAKLERELDAMRALYRSCKVGDLRAGDGRTRGTVALECERGPMNLRLQHDDRGKVTEAAFVRPPDAFCSQ